MPSKDYLFAITVGVFVAVVIVAAFSFVPRTTLAKWMPHGDRDAAAMHQAATTGQAKR